ncbi:myb-like protein X [Magallana gigas]|uniref:myb-like protein X n=1 Tax=Magallana gigas TaxID=29159 RepID=UPI003340950A
MTDMSALSKISERMQIHEGFVNSTDSSTTDLLAFSKEVSNATKESTDCIKDVAKYATKINEDLAKLRQLIKDFTVQIGDKMNALAEAGLFKDFSDPTYSGDVSSGKHLADSSEHRFSSDRFDKQRAEKLVLLQKIAEQQQELQKVLCETEGLITKVEETGFFTLGDFDNINGHLNQWIKGLETAEEREEKKRQEEERKRKDEEEKKKKAEEEAKQKAEEQRRKDEEEKRRKEEEERRKEEQRKKDEEARARRDPKNWPTFIYDRQKHHNLFQHGICCAVSAITGSQGLEKDDIVCAALDSHIDLERYPKNKEEVLISSMTQIKPTKGKEIKLDLPMKVYIPIASSSIDNREIVVKISMNDQKWRFVDAKEEKPRGVKDMDTQFVIIEIKNFQSLEVIVVSRPKRENMKVNAIGGWFEPTIDKNVRIIVPPGCFKNETGVHFKVDKDLANRAQADKQFENIKIATSLLGIELDDENLMNSKKTEGMQARRLLEEFKNCNAEQFASITEALERENQGHLAKLLKKTMEDIKNEEANAGSDFVGESDNLELQMVTSSQCGDWTVMKKESLKDFPDGVVISLPAKGGTFDIMGLIVPKGMDNKEISRIADLLYRQSYQIDAKLIVRHSDTDPTHCLVRCVENDRSIDATNTMEKEGFQKGPPDSPAFGICDGEEIIMKLEGNLTLDADNKVVRLRYYLNMDLASASFKIDVYNKRAQAEAKAFCGELRYNVGGADQGPPRCALTKKQKQEHLEKYVKRISRTGLVRDRNTKTREKFDKKRAENLVLLQKIAEQQQKLQKGLCETEGLISKVEETGYFTLVNFDNINGHLNLWVKGLETAGEREHRKRQEEDSKQRHKEEKQKKAAENAKRTAQEQGRKVEEEKKRKQEEQKRKDEEEKKRKQVEQRRKDEEKTRRKEEERRCQRSRNEVASVRRHSLPHALQNILSSEISIVMH